MAFSIDQLEAKARGTIAALGRLSAKERERLPNRKFVEDYNKLREQVLLAKPSIGELAPPAAQYLEGEGMTLSHSDSKYGEIEAYCEQLVALLRAKE